jgi:hypothetical protein
MSKPKRIELNIVRLSADLAARVDAWAAAEGGDRTDAIQRLVELGLERKAEASRRRLDDLAIAEFAASEIDRLIDPDTPPEERERRIHRLTEGPPEFVSLRIDLPGGEAR